MMDSKQTVRKIVEGCGEGYQSWRRGKRTSTYGAAAKLVMRILTCLFIYLTRTQEVK